MRQLLPLTKRQAEVLRYIIKFINEYDYAPSLREISDFLGTDNIGAAQYHIGELKSKGYLRQLPNRKRAIVPTRSRHQRIQLVGVIAAGKPREDYTDADEIDVPSHIRLHPNYQHYALVVKGDSMEDMGVLDGDTIIVRSQPTAEFGEAIVAKTENGMTLKILHQERSKIALLSRNKKYKPLYPKELEIQGVFVGLVRVTS